MNKKKQEERAKKFEVKKRTPKEKPDFFQNVTPFHHPVHELFKHAEEIAEQDTQPIIPNQPNVSNPTNLTKSTAPKSDFTRVPNSIAREAIPERLFKGMSKNTYDALYLKTRGAINPIRQIRATKSDLIRWTGVSDVTLDKHVRHLKSIGLLKVDFCIGSHEGNWYEVLIPEETDIPNLPNQPNLPNLPKKVGGDIPNLVGRVGGVELLENKEDSGLPKTSLKTNTISDDDALAKFAARIDEASRKLTKKGLRKDEEGKWEELAELLVMELEIAAARTKSITNVPAFLTEHLRRRLLGSPAKSAEGKSNPGKTTKVGKPDEVVVEEYQAEPLSKEGREAVLKTMTEYIKKGQQEFVMSQQDSYTKDDWDWLMKELK